jgi:hypothetical protein
MDNKTMLKESNYKGKHTTMLSLTLKNTSQINDMVKEIDIKSMIEELRELNQTCEDLKQILIGQTDEPNK